LIYGQVSTAAPRAGSTRCVPPAFTRPVTRECRSGTRCPRGSGDPSGRSPGPHGRNCLSPCSRERAGRPATRGRILRRQGAGRGPAPGPRGLRDGAAPGRMNMRPQHRVAFPGEQQPPSWRIPSLIGTTPRSPSSPSQHARFARRMRKCEESHLGRPPVVSMKKGSVSSSGR
jgi:hypothetical protein